MEWKNIKKYIKECKNIWYTEERSNTHIIGAWVRRGKENGTGAMSENIMVKNFQKLIKDTKSHIQEVWHTWNRINRKKTALHFTINLLKTKTKTKMWKCLPENKDTLLSTAVRLTKDISTETMGVRKYQSIGGNNC